MRPKDPAKETLSGCTKPGDLLVSSHYSKGRGLFDIINLNVEILATPVRRNAQSPKELIRMSKRKYDACLFDLDGVLVDTAKYHFLAWKRLADELNIPFDEEDNERLKGVSRMASLEIILSLGDVSLTEKEKVELATKKNEWYRAYILKMDPSEILPGALELLEDLRERGIKLALGSASKNAPTILEVTGLAPYFDAVVDGNSVSKAKPDPEVFLIGARSLGVEPVRCVVFEDAIAGIEAAKNAGMLAIGVGDPETLTEADHVVPNLVDFPLDRWLG